MANTPGKSALVQRLMGLNCKHNHLIRASDIWVVSSRMQARGVVLLVLAKWIFLEDGPTNCCAFIQSKGEGSLCKYSN